MASTQSIPINGQSKPAFELFEPNFAPLVIVLLSERPCVSVYQIQIIFLAILFLLAVRLKHQIKVWKFAWQDVLAFF